MSLQVSRHSSVIHEGEQSCHVAVPVAQPMLWDTLHPHLYRLEAALSADKAASDVRSVATFRCTHAGGGSFLATLGTR